MEIYVRGFFYRVVMKVMHKYGFHYAPKKWQKMERKIGELTKKEVRTYHLWCHWCGLRGDVSEFD